jgi:hypothetical protein
MREHTVSTQGTASACCAPLSKAGSRRLVFPSVNICRVALAAVQGYGGAPDRNVRPRTSGGGGAPAAAAAAAAGRYGVPPPGMPVGPPRQQQGFQPGAQQSQAVGFNPAAAAQQRGPPGYGAPGYGAGEDAFDAKEFSASEICYNKHSSGFAAALGSNPATAQQQRGPPGCGAPGYGAREDEVDAVEFSALNLALPKMLHTLQPPLPPPPSMGPSQPMALMPWLEWAVGC